MKLKVLKSLSYPRGGYNTRRLVPGDVFEASQRDGRLLLATRKVELMRDTAPVPPPPEDTAKKMAAATGTETKPPPADTKPPPADTKPLPATVGAEDMTMLRAEYERRLGRRPFPGWDAATLREKMAAADAS